MCPADTELFCRSTGRQSGFDEFLRCRNRLGIERRSLGFSTASSRRYNAVVGTLGDELSFEVRNRTEDVEYELAAAEEVSMRSSRLTRWPPRSAPQASGEGA